MNIFNMQISNLLWLSLLLATGGIFSAFFNSRWRGRIFAVIAGTSGLYTAALMLFCSRDAAIYKLRLGSLSFMLDNISIMFEVATGLGIFFFALYNASLSGSSRAYEQKSRFYYCVLGIFAASMLLVPIVDIDGSLNSALLFMSVWEVMSLFSFLLIVCSDEAKNVSKTALMYLIVMHISAAFLMTGFISISTKPFGGDIFGFWALLIGFGIKLGLFPSHFYMADSYEAAPGASAGLISGVMINMAVYGVLRTFFACRGVAGTFGYFLLIIGIISAVWGTLQALGENRTKKVLAGSSMENMGLIIIGIGVFCLGEYVYGNNSVSSMALAGVLIHSLNHSIFKSQLFYSADLIRNWGGTNNLDRLGGQGLNFPGLKKSSLMAILGISSLPPLNGFVGKFLLYAAFFKLMFNAQNFKLALISICCLVTLAVIGALSLFVFVKMYAMIFLGAAREKLALQVKNPENGLNKFVFALMSLLSLTIGIVPVLFKFDESELGKIFITLTISSVSMILVLVMVWWFRHILISLFGGSRRSPTWGCGYSNITPRMEYTADSLSLPLMRMLYIFFPRKENNTPISELYPADVDREYEIRNPIKDGVEAGAGALNRLMGKLQFLQSGMMQSYLWISVLFLIAAIIYAIISSPGAEVVK